MLKKDKTRNGCNCESDASTTGQTSAKKPAVHNTKACSAKNCSAKAEQNSNAKACSGKGENSTKACGK